MHEDKSNEKFTLPVGDVNSIKFNTQTPMSDIQTTLNRGSHMSPTLKNVNSSKYEINATNSKNDIAKSPTKVASIDDLHSPKRLQINNMPHNPSNILDRLMPEALDTIDSLPKQKWNVEAVAKVRPKILEDSEKLKTGPINIVQIQPYPMKNAILDEQFAQTGPRKFK